MTDDLLKRARRLDTCIFPTERSKCLCGELADRIEKLEATLRKIKDLHQGPEDEEVVIIRDDMTYFIVCEALGETA